VICMIPEMGLWPGHLFHGLRSGLGRCWSGEVRIFPCACCCIWLSLEKEGKAGELKTSD